MKQYCRYCSHCTYSDVAYCEVKNKTMSKNTAKSVNHCKDFEFNELDVFDIEKKYKPTEEKEFKQLKLF